MNEIDYTDRSFNKDSSEIYSLSVQANPGGLAYSVFDKTNRQVVLFKKYRFDQVVLISDLQNNMSEILHNDENLGLKYLKTTFVGYSRQTTLVPSSSFETEYRQEILAYNTGDSDGNTFVNYISDAQIYNIFSLPDEIVSLVRLSFSNVNFLNQTTPFLKRILSSEKYTRNVIYVGLNHEFFDVACIGPSGLLLYNTFLYSNDTDLLYYILFVYNSMGFNPGLVPIIVSGELSSKLSYLELLRQYIADVIFENAQNTILASGLKQLNASRFLNLLIADTCELSEENTKGEELR